MAELVKGSIADVARQTGNSIAETFLSCDVVCIVDTSGSMSATDSTAGRSRYDQACLELATLQGSLPGKIGVISFADKVMFCPSGTPLMLGGRTDLAAALKFAKIADIPGAMRFIVISDGAPNSEDAALKVARNYHNKIDTIFVGNEADPRGRDFLKQLAKVSGGSHTTAAQVKGLAEQVAKLLTAA